jgi:pseudouridine-5'-phosphate glycosidase
MTKLPSSFALSLEIAGALERGKPVVALESTVITHGLPRPVNMALAVDMEEAVRQAGAVPATIAVLDGKIRIGLDEDQLERLAGDPNTLKISSRDFASALAQGKNGGTTVAGSLVAAETAGLKVFATGGIGGVHRQAPYDVSTDLTELARRRVIVVCAGAKAILDLPATLEHLETLGVPVVGYQTDEFPAFYSVKSGLSVSVRADSPQEVAELAQAHWGVGLPSAVLVTVPPPAGSAIPADEVNQAIEQALDEAQAANIRGQRVTPFLLQRVSELSKGKSLQANLALLKNNATVAAQIAQHLPGGAKQHLA